MTSETITILSATRSELAGVTVGVGNIFERRERPGGWSCQLVLPDWTLIMAVGDDVDIAGSRFRLVAFEEGKTGRAAVFERFEDPPRRSLSALVDGRMEIVYLPEPLSASPLAKRLRELSPRILAALGPAAPVQLAWQSSSRDEIHREWNGGTVGPSTMTQWKARADDIEPGPVEANVSLDIVRWSPDEVYRTEIAAHWRSGAVSMSLSGRAEGLAPHETLRLLDFAASARNVLLQALGIEP